MLTKRTQILFDENLWFCLVSLSKLQDTSVGELVRRAVKSAYCDNSKELQNGKAIDHILSTRKKVNKIDYKELINYGRKY